MIKLDLTGQKFNMLTAIYRIDDKRYSKWMCRCACGVEKAIRQEHLKDGSTRSCGCHRKTMNITSLTIHGMARTKMYKKWNAMKQRCLNSNNKRYKDYGGRGITVVEKWIESFENFYNWAILNGYSDDLEIDRIDNNKGYHPENCRFVTRKENTGNRRNSIKNRSLSTEVEVTRNVQ